ncbi:MAG: dynamin family protein [Prevotella sp.]|nr:dynamin family protein [Prevotella sp.]
MEWKELEPKVAQVQKNLKDIFAAMQQVDTALLPERDNEVNAAGEMLDDELYDVVVCGEVKKGKSSFINALIGEAILPTNTEVATSQVFRIINSEEQRFSLVFTDKTRMEISREELSRYGSQVDADAEGEPVFQSHALDYIEICTPVAFLPKQVAIVDTPGIGALYTAHERITSHYLKRAAAVVFILDPQNPVTKPELDFVEKALGVTNQILFVMTKMDNYDTDYIVNMLRRNEELLAPFAPRTANGHIEVLPMSSMVLYNAAKEDIDVLRDVSIEESRYEPVRNEMMTMMQRTVGLSRNVYIYNVLLRYNSAVMASITEQSKALSQPGSSKELLEHKEELKKEFISEWGPTGTKQKLILQQVADRITALRTQLTTLTSTVGPLYTKYDEEIEALTLNEIDEYAQTLPKRIQNEFGQQWSSLIEECTMGIQQILQQYNEELHTDIHVGIDEEISNVLTPVVLPQMDFMQVFNHGRNGILSASLIAGAVSFIAPVIGGLLMLVGGWWFFGQSKNREKLLRSQAELRKFMSNAILKLNNEVCVKPASPNDPLSLEQRTERELSEGAQNALKSIYEQQKANVEKELNIISEQVKKEGEERNNALKTIAAIRNAWMPIHQKLVDTKTLLADLDKQLNSKETV